MASTYKESSERERLVTKLVKNSNKTASCILEAYLNINWTVRGGVGGKDQDGVGLFLRG